MSLKQVSRRHALSQWALRYLANYKGYYETHTHLTITLWRGASKRGIPVWPFALLAVLALIALLAW
jgi:hypothetical protein